MSIEMIYLNGKSDYRSFDLCAKCVQKNNLIESKWAFSMQHILSLLFLLVASSSCRFCLFLRSCFIGFVLFLDLLRLILMSICLWNWVRCDCDLNWWKFRRMDTDECAGAAERKRAGEREICAEWPGTWARCCVRLQRKSNRTNEWALMMSKDRRCENLVRVCLVPFLAYAVESLTITSSSKWLQTVNVRRSNLAITCRDIHTERTTSRMADNLFGAFFFLSFHVLSSFRSSRRCLSLDALP